jgi:hypothetical protein
MHAYIFLTQCCFEERVILLRTLITPRAMPAGVLLLVGSTKLDRSAWVGVRQKLALWSSRLRIVHEVNNPITEKTKKVTETATTQTTPAWVWENFLLRNV